MMSHSLPVLEITATQTKIPVYRLRAAIDNRGTAAALAIDNRGAAAALAIDNRGAAAALAIHRGGGRFILDHEGHSFALIDEGARLREAPSWSADLGLSWIQLCLVLLCGTVGVASGAFLAEQVLSGSLPKLASHPLAAPLLCLLQ